MEARLEWKKIILAAKIPLFQSWFHHEMKYNNFSWTPPIGGVQLSVKYVCVIVGGVHGRDQSGACRRRLVITADKCCDWVNNCLINIHAKIILFHFRRGSMLK